MTSDYYVTSRLLKEFREFRRRCLCVHGINNKEHAELLDGLQKQFDSMEKYLMDSLAYTFADFK